MEGVVQLEVVCHTAGAPPRKASVSFVEAVLRADPEAAVLGIQEAMSKLYRECAGLPAECADLGFGKVQHGFYDGGGVEQPLSPSALLELVDGASGPAKHICLNMDVFSVPENASEKSSSSASSSSSSSHSEASSSSSSHSEKASSDHEAFSPDDEKEDSLGDSAATKVTCGNRCYQADTLRAFFGNDLLMSQSLLTEFAPQLAQVLLNMHEVLRGQIGKVADECLVSLRKIALDKDISELHVCFAQCFQEYFKLDAVTQEMIRAQMMDCVKGIMAEQKGGKEPTPTPQKESKESPPKPLAVHVNIACDGCDAHPVRGIRYKSTRLADYDLCSACHSQLVPSEKELFEKIEEPIIYNVRAAHPEIKPIGQRYPQSFFDSPRQLAKRKLPLGPELLPVATCALPPKFGERENSDDERRESKKLSESASSEKQTQQLKRDCRTIIEELDRAMGGCGFLLNIDNTDNKNNNNSNSKNSNDSVSGSDKVFNFAPPPRVVAVGSTSLDTSKGSESSDAEISDVSVRSSRSAPPGGHAEAGPYLRDGRFVSAGEIAIPLPDGPHSGQCSAESGQINSPTAEECDESGPTVGALFLPRRSFSATDIPVHNDMMQLEDLDSNCNSTLIYRAGKEGTGGATVPPPPDSLACTTEEETTTASSSGQSVCSSAAAQKYAHQKKKKCCFWCGQPGHFQHQCGLNFSRPEFIGPRWLPVCFRCGGAGHKQDKCGELFCVECDLEAAEKSGSSGATAAPRGYSESSNKNSSFIGPVWPKGMCWHCRNDSEDPAQRHTKSTCPLNERSSTFVGPRREPGKCWYCGDGQHVVSDCYALNENLDGFTGPKRRASVCWCCKAGDHFESRCPLNEKLATFIGPKRRPWVDYGRSASRGPWVDYDSTTQPPWTTRRCWLCNSNKNDCRYSRVNRQHARDTAHSLLEEIVQNNQREQNQQTAGTVSIGEPHAPAREDSMPDFTSAAEPESDFDAVNISDDSDVEMLSLDDAKVHSEGVLDCGSTVKSLDFALADCDDDTAVWQINDDDFPELAMTMQSTEINTENTENSSSSSTQDSENSIPESGSSLKIIQKLDSYPVYDTLSMAKDVLPNLASNILGFQVHLNSHHRFLTADELGHFEEQIRHVPSIGTGTANHAGKSTDGNKDGDNKVKVLHLGCLGSGGGKVDLFMNNPSDCPWPHNTVLKLVYGDGAGFGDLLLAGITKSEIAKITLDFPPQNSESADSIATFRRDVSFWALGTTDGVVFGDQLVAIQRE